MIVNSEINSTEGAERLDCNVPARLTISIRNTIKSGLWNCINHVPKVQLQTPRIIRL